MEKEKKRIYDRSIVKSALRRPLRGGGWPANLPAGTMIRTGCHGTGKSIPGSRLYEEPLDRRSLWSVVKEEFATADAVSHAVIYIVIALTTAFAYVGASVALSALLLGGSNG